MTSHESIRNKHTPESRPRVVLVNRCFILNEHNQFLIVQRSVNDRHEPGLWEAPGGKLDEGQNLNQALNREVEEETGLNVTSISELVYADSEIISGGPYDGLPYVVLFSIAHKPEGEVKLSAEHEDYAWVTYEEAFEYELKSEVQAALKVLKSQLTQ